ncbi:MAG TPA: SH3 domain-containing protein [Thermoanaerobaculia bacterium]|jgi:TonB family protein|nr:SH3 domain-containing protein [Thermoanaerobaculia bacterium]
MGKRVLIFLTILAACAQPAPPPQPSPQVTVPTGEKSIGMVRVTATTLNVRQEASSMAAVVTQVKRGDQLTLLREENGWSKVRLATGEVGWVSSLHVSSGRQRTRKGCPPDSEYAFVKTPLASFSEKGPHGLVVVDATVNTRGDVTATRVISNSTGDESLAAMAEREIRSAKFTPPYRDCVPRTFIFTYKRSF